MKKRFSVFQLLSFAAAACNFTFMHTPASGGTLPQTSPPFQAVDSMVFVSKIRPVNGTCNQSDSTSVITLYRNADGSVDYRYITRKASASDLFKTYSAELPIVKTSPTIARIEVPSVGTFFAISFRNPAAFVKVGGSITFSCECCSGDGSCALTGSCCPQYITCDAGNCNGGCGLNARNSATAAALSDIAGGSSKERAGEFILVKATSLRLRK